MLRRRGGENIAYGGIEQLVSINSIKEDRPLFLNSHCAMSKLRPLHRRRRVL